MTTFTRQPLEDGAASFIIQTDMDRWDPPASKLPAWGGLAAGVVVFATTPGFSLVLGALAWWIVFRVLKRLTGSTRQKKIRGTVFMVSPAEVRGADGTALAARDIKEVVWRDWAIGRSDAGFGVYIDRHRGAALTIAKDMDGATAHRLANEIAGVLDVPATEGLARQFTASSSISIGDASVSPAISQGSPSISQGGGFATFAASEGRAAPTVSQGSERRTDGPQPGDVLLKETRANTFELQRVTRNGFEHWQDVPHSGLIDAMMFAQAAARDRNLWIEKMVDAGQPTLVPKLSQS